MSSRLMKIGLAVSLVLNLFLVGALAAGYLVSQRALHERGPGRAPPLFTAARSLPQAEQDRLRADMIAAARDAKPYFREARQSRREAVALAQAPTYDREAVRAALARSNASEVAGRTRLDARLTEIMSSMSPEARKALAPALGRGLRGPRMGGPRKDRDAPVSAPPPE